MAQYRCTQRVTLDGGKTVHEVGDVVDLTPDEVQILTRARAVEPVANDTATPAPQLERPDLEALKKADAELQAQIATLEHEGGVTQ
ncbi:MAG: hypothetical protein K6T78_12215 [Alicyclobacillus sp.]|nr:hypothetical protein [Alicyclobacillus sp.]